MSITEPSGVRHFLISLPTSLSARRVKDITSMPNVLSIPNEDIRPRSTDAVNLVGRDDDVFRRAVEIVFELFEHSEIRTRSAIGRDYFHILSITPFTSRFQSHNINK